MLLSSTNRTVDPSEDAGSLDNRFYLSADNQQMYTRLSLMQPFHLETGLMRPVKDSKLTSKVLCHLSEKPIHFSRRGCVLKLKSLRPW